MLLSENFTHLRQIYFLLAQGIAGQRFPTFYLALSEGQPLRLSRTWEEGSGVQGLLILCCCSSWTFAFAFLSLVLGLPKAESPPPGSPEQPQTQPWLKPLGLLVSWHNKQPQLVLGLTMPLPSSEVILTCFLVGETLAKTYNTTLRSWRGHLWAKNQSPNPDVVSSFRQPSQPLSISLSQLDASSVSTASFQILLWIFVSNTHRTRLTERDSKKLCCKPVKTQSARTSIADEQTGCSASSRIRGLECSTPASCGWISWGLIRCQLQLQVLPAFELFLTLLSVLIILC